jgi:hypothetical protein
MIGLKSSPLYRAAPRSPVIAVAILAGLAGTLWLAPAVAQAQNAPAVDKLIQMNKKALEDYETLEWDTAKRTLLQALVFAKKSNLDTHPMMARTYVHLGAVYVVGFKDKQKGLQSFGRALEIDPTIRISKSMSTPELEDLFAQAVQGGGAAAAPPAPTRAEPPPAPAEPDENAPPPPPSSASGGRRRRAPIMESEPPPPPPRAVPEEDDSREPDLPAKVNVLECPTKDETQPDRAVLVRCAMAPNLPVSKLFLFYLDPGAEDFSSVEMERSPKGWYAAKIPKKAVTGTSLRFYVEGRNDKGKVIVSNGRAESPNLMLIREAEAAATEKELGGTKRNKEENPFDEPDPNRPRRFLGHIDKSKIGLDTRFGNRRWWIGLGLGSGFGFAPASGLESLPQLSGRYSSGGAWAGLGHIAPEIGYQLSPNYAVSLEGRDQYIPQSRHFSSYAATGAHLVLAKLIAYTRQSRGRFFGSVALGGGEGFRLIAHPAAGLPAPSGGDPEYPNFKDTVLGGPVAAGVGGGFIYEISKSVSWMAEINLLAGIPKFAAVADLNTGFQISFGTTAEPPPEKGTKAVEPARPVKKRAAQKADDE